MKRITELELKNLPFGSVIRTIWNNSQFHEAGEEHFGVIFGNQIGWEDGYVDSTQTIAECMNNNLCITYLCKK